MKIAIVCLIAVCLVGGTGCGRGHDRVGDAPRTVSTSSTAGWEDISTSGLAMRLPSDWKIIDLAKETVDKGVEKAFGNDPKYASMRSQVSAMAKQGAIKLMAFDSSTLGSTFATNCNVILQDAPVEMTLDQVVTASVQQLSPMLAPGTQAKVEYLPAESSKVAVIRSQLKPPNPAVPEYVTLSYIAVKGTRVATITFSAQDSQESHVRPIADEAMKAFRFSG